MKGLLNFQLDSLNNRQRMVHLSLCLVAMIFLVLGYMLEEPYIRRATFLIVFSILFTTFLFVMYFIQNHYYPSLLLIILMTVSLIVIEYYSKFSINYLYHVLYFVIVLAVALYFSRQTGIVIATLVTIASFVKFIQLIYFEMTQNNIATFIFYMVIQILLISMVFVSKAYRIESRKTKNLYRELLDAYQQLDTYSRDIELLSAKEERSSIARDLHDTLGHDLTGLIMQLELANYNLESDEKTGRQYLEESIESARSSLTKVRAIVDTLKNQEKLVFTNQSLQELVGEYEHRTGIKVELKVHHEEAISPDYLLILYWIIQEGLTNVAKHSQSDKVHVTITHTKDELLFEIEDSSKSLLHRFSSRKETKVVKGNGLKGMEERLLPVDGAVTFTRYSGSYKGFLVKGRIPKKVRDND